MEWNGVYFGEWIWNLAGVDDYRPNSGEPVILPAETTDRSDPFSMLFAKVFLYEQTGSRLLDRDV
jgi:hypothetical protein